jgi:hypothetical protein
MGGLRSWMLLASARGLQDGNDTKDEYRILARKVHAER